MTLFDNIIQIFNGQHLNHKQHMPRQPKADVDSIVSAQLPSEAAKYLGSAPQPMASNLTSPPRLDVEATL